MPGLGHLCYLDGRRGRLSYLIALTTIAGLAAVGVTIIREHSLLIEEPALHAGLLAGWTLLVLILAHVVLMQRFHDMDVDGRGPSALALASALCLAFGLAGVPYVMIGGLPAVAIGLIALCKAGTIGPNRFDRPPGRITARRDARSKPEGLGAV
ncbi:DUF805 domain-containing protein [Marinivivus vitaminiproducens]|uniref:DUF805 domain-containing protein n=1 Tax=Marinivivus vitaminiproducens TaxID=3035935 RepID=UPI0027A7B543|nr:DUF805 domain-containing protein [Geminicoccaceae bacterium SCSIO 64248]